MITTKALPYNSELEAEVLGSIIVNNNKILDAMEILKADDFYKDKHRYIFKAIDSLYRSNKDIDMITLSMELKPVIDSIGGITYLSALTSSAMGSNIKNHCEILKELSNKRQVIKQCTLAIEKVYENMESKDIINEFTNSMLSVDTQRSKISTASEVMAKTLDFIEENFKNGGNIIGMPCGISSIDNATDGFIKKDVVVIAARPSMGKTLFATTVADGLSKNNKVAIFELEMSDEALGVRMLAGRSMMNGVKLRRGAFQDKEWSNITLGASNLSTRKLWIDSNPTQTIYNIKAKAKRLKMQNGLDCIIIDHIGLIEEVGKNIGNRNGTISEITRQAKIMAKELDICVILLSQLNRGVEARQDKHPMLSDLRESGSVEQDADLIMFLYRDSYYDPESEDKDILEVIVGKQRNGRTGTIKLFCDLGIQVIVDLDVIH